MKPSLPLPSARIAAIIATPFVLLALIFFVVYPNDFKLQTSFASLVGEEPPPKRGATGYLPGKESVKPDLRILIGILTLPDNYERRHLLRLVYSLQTPPPDVIIDVKFVFCNLTKEEQRIFVAMEIMKFDDIIILRCPENMNDGKTYTFFSSLPALFSETPSGGGPPYDYVMKADDDIFFRLSWLAESLRRMPRDDLYYGFVAPCPEMDPFKGYMAGMGYVLSWDIVQWISVSDIPRNNKNGHEDIQTNLWLRQGRRGMHRYNTKFAMYDVPVPFPGSCMHEFTAGTIGVHKLKDNSRWSLTLKFFNFTEGLKPSKFYHLD